MAEMVDTRSDLRIDPSAPPRRRLRARLARWALLALAGLVGLAGTGLLYQTVATAIDRQQFTSEGSLVDVGGYNMHIHCTGTGSPTVVLEAGAGAPSPIWAWVQPAVAQQTRVCSYDRAGLGWSDTGTQPRDATSIARELHTLLLRAGETGPFVLAGHSLGGQYALMFAELYAEDTAGLVLIEAQHPDTLFRTPAAQEAARAQQRQVTLFVALSQLGVVRLFNMAPADQRLPAASQAALNQAVDRTDLVMALRDEQLAVPTNREQLQVGGAVGSLPVSVVSGTEHGMDPELESYTLGLQRELAALSTNSRHNVVAGADHMSLITDQTDSLHTVRAIGDMLDLVHGLE